MSNFGLIFLQINVYITYYIQTKYINTNIYKCSIKLIWYYWPMKEGADNIWLPLIVVHF